MYRLLHLVAYELRDRLVWEALESLASGSRRPVARELGVEAQSHHWWRRFVGGPGQ
jgi:hypothetical protein